MSADFHMFLADLLHRSSIEDRDGFALSASKVLAQVREWHQDGIVIALSRVRTDMFRRNTDLSKKATLQLLATSILRKWPTTSPGIKSSAIKPTILTVLFLAANPADATPLALDEEIREINAKIRASEYRDSLRLVSRWAVRPDDLLQAFNEERPHIVHFSGHGNTAGELILLDQNRRPQPVSAQALGALFGAVRDNIRLAFFNACLSKSQAQAVTKHIDYAIGMKRPIGDAAAIAFAASFYRALGFERTVEEAFEQGKAALKLAGIPEDTTPQLLKKKGSFREPLHCFEARTPK
jgi:hypothetical protein